MRILTPEGENCTCMVCELVLDWCECKRKICKDCNGTGWGAKNKICWTCEGVGKLEIIEDNKNVNSNK